MQHAEALNAADASGVVLCKANGVSEQAHASGVYTATLYDKDGNVKWEDTIDNLVTTVGGNFALNGKTQIYGQ